MSERTTEYVKEALEQLGHSKSAITAAIAYMRAAGDSVMVDELEKLHTRVCISRRTITRRLEGKL